MKITKTIFLWIALTVIPSAALLAQKCKFDKDEKDKFTNVHIRSSKFQVGGMFYRWFILLEQKGDKYYMTYQIAVNGKVDDPIKKGNKIMMKLEDNSIVELEVDQDYNPQQNVENTGTANPFISSMWLPKGELSKEQMTKLSNSPISAIRINIAGKDLDSPEIAAKQSKKLKETSACMLVD